MKKLIALIMFISTSLLSNNDSLMKIVNNKTANDTTVIKAANRLAEKFLINRDYKNSEKYALIAYSKSKSISYKKGIAFSSVLLGIIISNYYDTKKSLEYLYESYDAHRELNDTICNNYFYTLDYLSSGYCGMGVYDKAISFRLRSINIADKIKSNVLIAQANNNLASIYTQKGDFDKAISQYEKTFKIVKTLSDTTDLLFVFGGLGDNYLKKDLNKALGYYNRYLNIAKFKKDSLAISFGKLPIAQIYNLKGEHNKAIDIANELLTSNNNEILAETYSLLGEVYKSKNNHKLAYNFFKKSLDKSHVLGWKEMMVKNYKSLYILDSIMGDYRSAFENNKLYTSYRDSIFNVENEKKIVSSEMSFNFDKEKSLIKAKQDEMNKVAELKQKSQRNIIISIAIILAIVVFVSVFIYKGYLNKKKSNAIIIHQKQLVEEKQKEIVDNITYAKRIQAAIMPSHNYINENANNFILYKPKDIVSGDFYWASSVLTDKLDEKFYIAVADCTGHGVSGAFMSLLNISILNELVNERNITDTGRILNEARKEIIKSLNPKGNENVSDGMDCVLCAFDFKNRTLEYSCANNNFYIIRNKELIVCTADKMPVGLGIKQEPFKSNTIQLEKGDMVYLFTDGYADQFGGEKGKKFKYKQLEELLISISDREMNQQKNCLDTAFQYWKGDIEQTDDVLITGIKID